MPSTQLEELLPFSDWGFSESRVFKSLCSLNPVGYALAFRKEPAERQHAGTYLGGSGWP